jgi:hypothetical protein
VFLFVNLSAHIMNTPRQYFAQMVTTAYSRVMASVSGAKTKSLGRSSTSLLGLTLVVCLVATSCSTDDDPTPSVESTSIVASATPRPVSQTSPTASPTVATLEPLPIPTASPSPTSTVLSITPTVDPTIEIVASSTPVEATPTTTTPVITPTQTITPPTSVPVPSATAPPHTPSATALPTPLPSPTATATATPTTTPTPVVEPTATPFVSVPATQTPSPTAIPTPDPDPRYGLILHGGLTLTQQTTVLDRTGASWYLDWTSDTQDPASTHNKLLHVNSVPGPSDQHIINTATANPGAVWYIIGEPNRKGNHSPAEIIPGLRTLYSKIKAADPTARVTSPSVLNWDFTCIGCGGYGSGLEWANDFRQTWLATYSEEPPVDIWAIDVYPINWWNLPTVDHAVAIQQIQGLRAWLDAIPGQSSKPIWVTEIGLHWGYDVLEFDTCGSLATPGGTYQTEAVKNYFGTVFDWLESNADSSNIEKWFIFKTYADIVNCNTDGYAGMTIFENSSTTSPLSEVGQYIVDRINNIQ